MILDKLYNEAKQWELLARLEKTLKNPFLSFETKIASLEYLLLKYREEYEIENIEGRKNRISFL